MKAIIVLSITFALIALSIFSLPFLDQNSALLSPEISARVRDIFNYCIDGGSVYKDNVPFASTDGCTICACNSEINGVMCTQNSANPTCLPKTN